MKVISIFRDLQDNGHIYRPGDKFPRDGVSVSDERIMELSTANNARGKPLIAAETPVKPAGKKPKEQAKRAPRGAKKAVSGRNKEG